MFPIKIERPRPRIVLSVIVGGVAGFAAYGGFMSLAFGFTADKVVLVMFFVSTFLAGPAVATVLAHVLTPKERLDGHTRCGKCGYILKGLTEPRCSECGERI